jgi:3-methyladenine DNA glycosylase AlkC
LIGTLPTVDEARRFLGDKRADRRARLVSELLERPEYADYWALKWADVLQVDRQKLGHKQAYAYYRWIRESLAANKPFDQFARELLTAEGPLEETGPANFYKVVNKPGEAASTLSQVLLGVRIACAECHHHPFDRWSQTDYFGMTAFFTPLTLRPSARGESVQAIGDPVTKHPRTGETILPRALAVAGSASDRKADAAEAVRSLALPATDRRVALADWMTARQNPFFARNLANRTWAHFLGRGLVEPIDDVRDTNPPSNPELLDALAKHVVATKYDVKQLMRTITKSRTYQLSSKPNATNERDEQNFSRALFRRIEAEVLLDMVSQSLGVPEKFGGAVPGTRAIQLWDSKVNHYFLKLYGRPQRATACECERIVEPSVAQVLHLLNSPEIHAKLTHERGNVAKWVREKKNDAELVAELYLTFYSRLPDEAERKTSLAFLQRNAAERRQAAEDLAWTLMNTLEFGFKR